MGTDLPEYNDIKKFFNNDNYNHLYDCIPDNSNYVVIYPPTIDWDWMKQRPQQLMEQFSLNGFEVYYCNKTQSKAELYTAVNPNLKIIHNNSYFISKTIPTLKQQGKKIILWVSWSKLNIFLKAYLPDFIIYDYLDDYAVWKPYHKDMVNSSDIVISTSTTLEKQIVEQFPYKKCFLIPNGCDINHFNKTMETKKPNEFQAHKGPIIMYSGAWASWIDDELVYEVANEFKNSLVVIIGTQFGKKVNNTIPNIKYLGYMNYDLLPNFIKHSTVCIIPFKIEDLTIAANPIKMYEYLASGKPVVSTDIPEARNIPAVHVGKNHLSFIQKIRSIFDGTLEFPEHDVNNWLSQQTWEKRIYNILDILSISGIYKKP